MCDMQKMPSREDASCEEDSDMNFATFSPVGTAGTHFVTAGGQVPITKLQQNVANNGAGMPQVCVMGDGGVQYMRALDTNNTLQGTPQLISVPVVLPGAKPGDPQATVQIQVLNPNLLQQQPKYQMQIPIQGYPQAAVLTVAYSPDANEAGGIQLVGQGSLGEGLQILSALPQEMQLVQSTQEKEHVPMNMPQVYITPNQQIIINGAEKAFNNNTTSDNHNPDTIVIKEECDDDESSQGTEIGETINWKLHPNHQQDIVKYLKTLPPQQQQVLPESLQQFLRLTPSGKLTESIEIEVENAVVTKEEEPVAEAVLSEGNIAGPSSNKRLHELNLQLNKDVCKHSKKKVVAAIANYINHLREICKRKARVNSQKRLEKALPYYDGVVINLDDENEGIDIKVGKLNEGNCRFKYLESKNFAVSLNNNVANSPNKNTMPLHSFSHARDHSATLINHERPIGMNYQPQVNYSPNMTNNNSNKINYSPNMTNNNSYMHIDTKGWSSNAQFNNFDFQQNSELDSMTDDEQFNYIARINYELNLQYYANKSNDSITTKTLDSVEVKGTLPKMQNTTHARSDPVSEPSYNIVMPTGEYPPKTNATQKQSFAHPFRFLKSGSVLQLNDPKYMPQIKNVKEEEIFLKNILDFLDQSISSKSKLSEKDLAVQISEYISRIELTNNLELKEKFRKMIDHRLLHSLHENTEQSKITPTTHSSLKINSNSDIKYSDVKHKQEYIPNHKPNYEEFAHGFGNAQNSRENGESRDSKENLLQNETPTSNEVIKEKNKVMSNRYPQNGNKSKSSVSNITTTKGNFTKTPEHVNESETHESLISTKPEHNFKLVIFGEYNNKSKLASREVIKPRLKLEHQLSTESGYESSPKQHIKDLHETTPRSSIVSNITKNSDDFLNKNNKSNQEEPPIYEISSDDCDSDAEQKHDISIPSNKYTAGHVNVSTTRTNNESDDSELLNTALHNIRQKTEIVFANDIDKAAFEHGYYSAMLLDSIDLLDIPIPPGKPNDTSKTHSDTIQDTNTKTHDESIIKLQSDRQPFTHATWIKLASRNLTHQPLMLRVLDYDNVDSDSISDKKFHSSKYRENVTSHNDTEHHKHKSHEGELTEEFQSKTQPDMNVNHQYSKKPDCASSKYEGNIKRNSPSKIVLPKYEPYQDRRLKHTAYTVRKNTENKSIRQLPEYSSELHSKNKALGSKLQYKDWDRIEESGSRCKIDTKDNPSHNTKREKVIYPLDGLLRKPTKTVENAPQVKQQLDNFDYESIKSQNALIPTEPVRYVPSPGYEVTIDSNGVLHDNIVHLEQSPLLTNSLSENTTELVTVKTTSDNFFDKLRDDTPIEKDKCVEHSDTISGHNPDVTNERDSINYENSNNYIENKTLFYYNNKMITKIWSKNTIGQPKVNIHNDPIKYVTQDKQNQPEVENKMDSVTNKTQKGTIFLDYVPDTRKKNTKPNKTESEPSCNGSENQSNLNNKKPVRVPQSKGIRKILKERRLNRSLGFISRQMKSKTADLSICPILQKESKNHDIETENHLENESETNRNASDFTAKYIKNNNNTFQMTMQNQKVNIKIVDDPEECPNFNNSLSDLSDNKDSLTKLDSHGNTSLPIIDIGNKKSGLKELEYDDDTTKPVPLFDNNNYLLQPDSHGVCMVPYSFISKKECGYEPTMPDPPRTETYSENPDSPRTDTYSENSDSPRTDNYSENSNSPGNDTRSENPDSCRTDTYSGTADSPKTDINSAIADSPRTDTYSTNPDSPTTVTFSENSDLPDTYSETPDSPGIDTYTETPDSPGIDTYSETLTSPGINTCSKKTDTNRTDKYSASADSPKTDINSAIPNSPRTDEYSAYPDSRRTDIFSIIPDLSRTDTYSKNSDLPGTDTYPATADSPRIDTHSVNPDSPKVDTYSVTPDSPRTNTHSENPDSPRIDTCSATANSPRIDTHLANPNSPKINTYAITPDSPRIDTHSENLDAPRTSTHSENPESSRTDTYSATADSPGIDTHSEILDSHRTDTYSATPDSPKTDTYTENPNSPRTDTCSVTPDSFKTKCLLPIPINCHKNENSLPMVVTPIIPDTPRNHISLARPHTTRNEILSLKPDSCSNNIPFPKPEETSSISDPKEIDVTTANNDKPKEKILPKLKILKVLKPAPHTKRLGKRTITYKCIEWPLQEPEKQLTENTTNNDTTFNKNKQTSSEAKVVKPIKISKSQIFNLKGTPSLKPPRELLSEIDGPILPTQTPSSNINSVTNKARKSDQDQLQVTIKRIISDDDNTETHSCKKKIKLGKKQKIKPKKIKIGTCTCFNKCPSKIKASEQLCLSKKFHKLDSLGKKSLFLNKCLEIYWKVTLDPMENNKRKYIVHYSLPNAEGIKHRVCKKFFQETFLLSDDQLDELTVTRKKMMNFLPITKP